MALRSFKEFYDSCLIELQSQRPDLTDAEAGSLIDIICGVIANSASEVSQIVVDEFKKTFFSTADGPEITGGRDYLEELAVDHYGETFKRPAAVKSTGTITFTRPSAGPGNCTIPIGTVVKTVQSATGSSVRFETVAQVIMTGTTINASVRAIVAGVEGNVQPSTVTQIESTLTDSTITVNNSAAFTGGKAKETDAEYRETIRLLLESLKGGTKAAIEAKALTVGGVELATATEFLMYAKEWNIISSVTIGAYFGIPRARLYIADANGTASQALINDVKAAIETVRADGVKVEIIAAAALSQAWTASITLNPSGPNYATLQSDTTLIKDLMIKYIQDLPIGATFSRATAKAYILAVYGSAGTNDLLSFSTSVPSGDVSPSANQKLIPGTMSIV